MWYSAAFTDGSVDELLVFLGKMRRKGIPNHLNTGNFLFGSVLREIFAISGENVFLDFADGFETFSLNISSYRLWHTPHIVILAEEFNILLAQRINDRPVAVQKQLGEFLIA